MYTVFMMAAMLFQSLATRLYGSVWLPWIRGRLFRGVGGYRGYGGGCLGERVATVDMGEVV